MGFLSFLKSPAPDWLRKIEKVTRGLAIGGIAVAGSVLARKYIPPSAILPFAKKAAVKVASKITVKRAIVGSVIGGAALTSPTVRDIIKKAPTAPFKAGKKLGSLIEEQIAPVAKKEPKGKVAKALATGGVVGLAVAGGLVAAKKIKEARAAKVVDAATASTSPISTVRSIPATLAAASSVVPSLAEPQVEVISPTAVTEPKKVKRTRARRRTSPLVINQIQFSVN